MSEALQEAMRYAPTTPHRPIKSKGISAPRQLLQNQRFKNAPKRASPPPPPPYLDRQLLTGFEKLQAMQSDIAYLAENQKLLNELNWEKFGSMPDAPEDGVELMCPPDVADSAPSELSGATARLALTALEASSFGSETEGGTSMAGMPIGPSDHRQGQTFQNRDGALFYFKDYDGKGGGIFTLSEKRRQPQRAHRRTFGAIWGVGR